MIIFKRCLCFLICIMITQFCVHDTYAGNVDIDGNCTTSTDCKDGLYCNPTALVCASCNKPDGATWVSNGPRSGTGVNSCQWQYQCPPQPAHCESDQTSCGTQKANDETVTGYGTTTPNCTYNNNDNITCNSSYYRDNDTCKKCPYGSTSRSGATSRKNCFFDSGTIIYSNDGTISLSDIMYIY